MRTRSALTSALIVAASVGVAFLLTLALEWAAGVYLYSSHRNAGLIWGPYSTVRHTTREFSYVARINNLGFRDRDFSRGKAASRRAIVLGDSFTYGWGVNNDDPWPKVLERSLNHVEVANLGSPGGYPRSYADLAEKAILLLRPDLVIVAVVQSDDLHQSAEKAPSRRRSHLLTDHYPNLMQWIGGSDVKKIDVSAEDLAGIWKKQVTDFTAQMEPAERRKFDGLAAPIREAFLEGQLNPGLLYYSIRFPSFLLDTCDLDAPATRAEIDEMSAQLARINELAKRWGATALVVSIPYPPYASEHSLQAMRELGFATRPDLLESTKPDEAVERAARRAGLPFLTVTREFRQEARRRNLFFRLDGHLNPLGHQVYASLLAPLLAPRIR
jgi:lysophospholipase L1-like esterase